MARGLTLVAAVVADTMRQERQIWRASGDSARQLPLGSFDVFLVAGVAGDGRAGVIARRSGTERFELDLELHPDDRLVRIDTAALGMRVDFGFARYAADARIATTAYPSNVDASMRAVRVIDRTRSAWVEVGRFAEAQSTLAYLPAWSPDGRAIAVAAGDSLTVHRLPGALRSATRLGSVSSIAWAPAPYIAVSEFTQTLTRRLRVLDSNFVEVLNLPTADAYGEMAWSPDGRRLAMVNRVPIQGLGYRLSILDRERGRIITCALADGASLGLGGWNAEGTALVVNTNRRAWLLDASCSQRVELLGRLGQARRVWVVPS